MAYKKNRDIMKLDKAFTKKNKLFYIVCLFLSAWCAQVHARVDNVRVSPVVSAVQKISSAVVNISTEEIVRSNPFMSLDPFSDDYFRNFFEVTPLKRSRQSLGSGVIIDAEGHVITNEHVIARATNIMITLSDNRVFSAKVIGADPDFDIAVLKLDTNEHFPQISLGTSSDLMPGETVIAIGNPFGLSHTVTTGVVSAVHRSIKTGNKIYEDFIQTDAAINPGNSGGPLVNIKGELIGINTAIYREGEGIGFAIPVDKVQHIAQDLLVYGEVRHAYLGIKVQDLTLALKKTFDYSGRTGLLISTVDSGSPADDKLVPGDIIIEFNDKVVNSRKQFVAHSKGLVAGENVKLRVFRDGKYEEITIATAEFPLERIYELCWDILGVKVEDYKKRGVLIKLVNPNSPAGYIGIKPGDLIIQVGDKEIKSVKELSEALIRYRNASSVFMFLGRGRYAYRFTVPLN